MSIEDRKAVSGYVFIFDGGAVSWSARQQSVTALSTTAAEYIAMAHATKEALWLRHLLSELFGKMEIPFPLYDDNEAAIALAYADIGQFHAWTKNIDICYHFIRDHSRLSVARHLRDEIIDSSLELGLVTSQVGDSSGDGICRDTTRHPVFPTGFPSQRFTRGFFTG